MQDKLVLIAKELDQRQPFIIYNAMIREYVAIVVMGRKRHMKICGTILGFALFLSVLSFIIS